MPSKYCCIVECQSGKASIKHRFPINNSETFMTWVNITGNPKLNGLKPVEIYKKFVICDEHFEMRFKNPCSKRLMNNAVPTKNLPLCVFLSNNMPKDKLVTSDEPSISRPQRNMKAKIVFDPSDVHIPKKRNKSDTKPENITETGKKSVHVKKQSYEKSKNSIVNEHFDCSSNELFPVTASPSPHPSPVKRSEISKDICYLCKVLIQGKENMINCPICLLKVHKSCLIAYETIWKIKLDLSPWLCKTCRKNHCSKCLQDNTHSDISNCCMSCNIGSHKSCNDSYNNNPLHTIQLGLYICTPCMSLATKRVPGVEDVEDDDSSEKHQTTDDDGESYDGDTYDEESNLSSSVSALSVADYDVGKICLWTINEVYNYFVTRVPQPAAEAMKTNEVDGQALLLLKRKDITSMDIILGHAMKLYKEVRILQTQKTCRSVYWE